jgi:hypothetical protein
MKSNKNMKMLTNNTTRRDALKRLAAIGALAFVPSVALWSSPAEQTTHIVGLGGAGLQLLPYFQKRLPDARFTCIDTELPDTKPENMEFITVNLASNLYETIQANFGSNDHYVLLAGLGGTTGTHLAEQLSSWLHRNQQSFMTICSLPFTFQGAAMRLHAEQAAARLSSLPGFHCIDLDEIGKPHGHLLMGEVFEKVDEAFYAKFLEELL